MRDKRLLYEIILVFILCAAAISGCGKNNSAYSSTEATVTQENVKPETSTPAPTDEPAVSPMPTPESTPTPTPSPTPVPEVIITKSPSGETLTAGGQTWFIANADNAISITWFFKDPYGNIYTVESAQEANPGLKLDVLEQYTISVANVPSSLNGWHVFARFDGYNGYADTGLATIYVQDYTSYYSDVLSRYRTALRDGVSTENSCYEYGVSLVTAYTKSVGYALIDMDGNGIPELLIIGNDQTEEFTYGMVLEADTYYNGQVVQIVSSMPRSRNYLLSNNEIYGVGSGGAANAIRETRYLSGTSMIISECYVSDLNAERNGVQWFSSPSGQMQVLDYTNCTPITTEAAEAAIAAIESRIIMPEITNLNID